MMQEHSFFSRPLTYFGESQNCCDDEDDWTSVDLPTIFFDDDRIGNRRMQTGLFLNWVNVNE